MIEHIANSEHADVVRTKLNNLIDIANSDSDSGSGFPLSYMIRYNSPAPHQNPLCIRETADLSGKTFYLYRKRKIIYGNKASGNTNKYYKSNGYVLIRGYIDQTNPVSYKAPMPLVCQKFTDFAGLENELYASYNVLKLGTDFKFKHGDDLPVTSASYGATLTKVILENLMTGYQNNNLLRDKYGFFGIHSGKRFRRENLLNGDYKGKFIEQKYAICDNVKFKNPSFFTARLSVNKKAPKDNKLFSTVGEMYLSFTIDGHK